MSSAPPRDQDFVIVVINGHGAPPLARGKVHDLYFGLVPALARVGIEWLAEGEAVELHLKVEDRVVAEGILDALAVEMARKPVDLCLLPTLGRRKRLLVADMESTMVEEECLDELALEAGIGARIADITTRSMRGELPFEAALRERVGLLKGLPETSLARLRDRLTPIPGASAVVATMHRHGAHTALVSGGFTYFTAAVASRLGFDSHYGNRLNLANEALDGTVAEPILGRNAKLETLRQLAATLGLSPTDTLAVGDGANDVAMVREAGIGVAFRAKPVLEQVAPVVLRHADLTGLLYVQGYRSQDFASSV